MSQVSRPRTLGQWLRRHSLTLVAAVGGAAGVAYAAAWHRDPTPEKPPAITSASVNTTSTTTAPTPEPVATQLPRDNAQDVVQIALILDTSSSMNGLINQARSHLWNMVDEMGKMTRVVNGKTRGVRIELALYEYGNDTLSVKTGFIREVQPFTSDLDRVSEKLHALFTNGGSEYAGQAIETAVSKLQWSSDPGAMRFVFLAGNEEFDQGPVTAATAMKAAAGKDINVQLIYCGSKDTTWEAAAKLAKSDLTTIDQNHVAAHIPAPQDDEILRLGQALNRTYLAYGDDGEASIQRQTAQDTNSMNMSAKVALERAQLKSKNTYRNDSWDVVDAVANNDGFWAQTADDKLPAELRGKSLEEKQRIVSAKAAERVEIQKQIAKLEAERTAFLNAELAKQGDAQVNSLQSELMKSTKRIATQKGYKF